ncbi:hypothetical protein K402DRAFT_430408 [Aulographum hederae CBS 113979]|uniref:Uncharacterized protein n=1 Tax=Aulographum hederae CBS 113979 TaxID=1176131 RepID=A0A6G1HFM4_9PEZI|nr:hypothetical protein K402DRAFT_430408 [Aulographum hederae CBS 113979]
MSNPPMQLQQPVVLPRVAITYCTQCRWMLRAAYFGQELLSTFGTTIGEIALIPATGGTFSVELVCTVLFLFINSLYLSPPCPPSSAEKIIRFQHGDNQTYIPPTVGDEISSSTTEATATKTLLWDRKTEGGFPETKVLKQRVRDHLDPKRDLGHSDRDGKKKDAVGAPEGGGGEKEKEVDEANSKGSRDEEVKSKEPKRNPDGSICEDCN